MADQAEGCGHDVPIQCGRGHRHLVAISWCTDNRTVDGTGAASVSFEAEEGGFVAANDNDMGDHNF